MIRTKTSKTNVKKVGKTPFSVADEKALKAWKKAYIYDEGNYGNIDPENIEYQEDLIEEVVYSLDCSFEDRDLPFTCSMTELSLYESTRLLLFDISQFDDYFDPFNFSKALKNKLQLKLFQKAWKLVKNTNNATIINVIAKSEEEFFIKALEDFSHVFSYRGNSGVIHTYMYAEKPIKK